MKKWPLITWPPMAFS